MGNSACCSAVQDEQQQELIVIVEDTTIKSQQVKLIQENCVSFQVMELDKQQQILYSPIEKQKGVSNYDPSTPGFPEGKSQLKEQSFSSNKIITLVAEIVLNIDEQAKYSQEFEDEKLVSESSTKKRQKKDSPRSEFKPKNSLKFLDLQQIAKQKSLIKARKNSQDIDMSFENQSIKSALKQEKKYSKHRKNQTQGDLVSSKKVHFQK